MTQHISGERKTAYYVGMGLMILGVILFASTLVSFAMHFGDFSDFESNVTSGMVRTFGGMALIVVGGIIRGIGARGLAGSGAVLDPEKARQDLEPYSRMVGGMAKDALEAADVKLGGRDEKVVMVRCRSCGKLNEEDSKFCQDCGKEI